MPPAPPAPPGPPASPSAARHLPSLALFLGLFAAVLAADLITKPLAFDHVGDQPIRLERSSDDGTTLVYELNSESNWTLLPRMPGHEDAPASALPPHEGRTVVPKVLRLKLMLNTGAVFGIGKNKQWFFAIVSVFAVGVIGYIFVRSRAGSKWLHICLALILAGAVGNLYDRARFNAVRDMCELFPDVNLPFGWSWPGGARALYPWIFNIADVALVVGVIMMLILMWRADRQAQRAKAAEKATAGKPR